MRGGCENVTFPVKKAEGEPLSVAGLLYAGTQYLQQCGLSEPRREAMILLQTVLSCNALDFYTDRTRIVFPDDQETFWTGLRRRGQREPLQYILGEVDFYGMPLHVVPGVFIPRPETELIVQIAASCVPPPKRILDLCTGSGALAIALARQFPEAQVIASDTSKVALEAAQKNQKRHGQNIFLIQGDLLSAFKIKNHFDLIVSNPPYIAEQDRSQMDPDVYLYEPHDALFSPDNGHAHLRQILKEAPDFLTRDGHLLLEIGAGQSADLLQFIKRETPFRAEIYPDWAGIPRILHSQYG